MKKNSFKVRNILVGALASLFTITLSVPAFANQKSKSNIKAALSPTVKFIGAEANSAFFSVNLENETPAKFELTIKDANGGIIYRQVHEASKFSKVFKLVNEEATSTDGISFRIKELASGVDHNFEVSTDTEYVKEVEISKI